MECPISNACNAVWDFNACKTGAIRERITANACYAVTDYNAGKSGAIIERTFSNGCHAVWDFNACKSIAKIERMTANACYAVSSTVISYSFRNYYLPCVFFASRSNLYRVVCFIGNVVINAVDFKVVSVDNRTKQQ